MLKKNTFLIALFFFGFLSRFLLLPKMQTHVDSASYTLALINYNLQQETPAPPGYPLYFAFAKLIMLAVGDPYTSLLLVSALFSGAGAVVFYLFGKIWANKTLGIIAATLFLSSPTFYFFGLTAYVYLVNAVMTTIVALLVFLIISKGKQYSLLLGVVYALSLGARPQEVITTFPLFLYGIILLKKNERIKSVAIFLFVSLFWLVPFIFIVGGPHAYYEQLTHAAATALPSPNIILFIANRFKLASGFFLTFGAGVVFILLYFLRTLLYHLKKRNILFASKEKVTFFAVWALPSLLFNLFIRSDHAGYQTGYLTCGIFLLAVIIWKIFKNKQRLLVGIAAFICLVNLFLFFYNRDPEYRLPYRQTSFHYSDLQRNDFELSEKISFVKKNFLPSNTLILVSYVFWRQYSYYLPEYKIIDLNGFYTNDMNVINQVRESMYWKRVEYKNISRIFIVPVGIKNIVFLDDEVCEWKINGLLIRRIEKNICVSSIKVQKGEKFSYAEKKFFKKQ